MLKSALLFYKKLRGELEDMGFEVNPYDPCVVNKIINRTQMTVRWHVEDLKVSHKDPMEVTKFIMAMGHIYGSKMSVTRGKVHEYLGMDLDYDDQVRR